MILILGDYIEDHYEEYKTIRTCSEGFPIVEKEREWIGKGGAGAVCEMVQALGQEAMFESPIRNSKKRRVCLDGKPIFREDFDTAVDTSQGVAAVVRTFEATPDIVLVSDYGKGEISREVIEVCLERQWRVIVDPCKTSDPATYDGVYGIVPNRNENRIRNYWLRYNQFPRVCLKLDVEGMHVRNTGYPHNVYSSIAKQPIVDVCGAGDQVLATIGVMLSRGFSWLESCRLANIAAGLKCAKRGATPVTLSELESYDRTNSMASVD